MLIAAGARDLVWCSCSTPKRDAVGIRFDREDSGGVLMPRLLPIWCRCRGSPKNNAQHFVSAISAPSGTLDASRPGVRPAAGSAFLAYGSRRTGHGTASTHGTAQTLCRKSMCCEITATPGEVNQYLARLYKSSTRLGCPPRSKCALAAPRERGRAGRCAQEVRPGRQRAPASFCRARGR